jgi:hypothetical protein
MHTHHQKGPPWHKAEHKAEDTIWHHAFGSRLHFSRLPDRLRSPVHDWPRTPLHGETTRSSCLPWTTADTITRTDTSGGYTCSNHGWHTPWDSASILSCQHDSAVRQSGQRKDESHRHRSHPAATHPQEAPARTASRCALRQCRTLQHTSSKHARLHTTTKLLSQERLNNTTTEVQSLGVRHLKHNMCGKETQSHNRALLGC